jgi:NAD-dependent deacetylase
LRRSLVAAAEPNPGHRALAGLERRVPAFTLVTQNVDGLHERACSTEVLELHGNILCSRCSLEGEVVAPEEQDDAVSPRCPRCGALLRPDVVWFGEMLPPEALQAASEAARGCDVFFSIGTSSLVYPAAALPYGALENGATLIEINPSETPLTRHSDYSLRGDAGEVLPDLLRKAFGSPIDQRR